MLTGFKEFIMRGNVIQLAVGVVIGSAFTAIVTSITKSVIYPIIAAFGEPSAPGLGFHLRSGNPATFVDLSAVITAVINFFLVAAVVYFIIVLPMNKLVEAQKRRAGVDEESADPTETELLAEIRDLLASQATPQQERKAAEAEARRTAESTETPGSTRVAE
ncbi:large conductance mechanosensitive channel protein MscL [Corynebacterium tapiri]|uniref:Large-conductance mechanosensitive channel n=1 Tax=Corynebacterium tapiri TaxID=1448266 RepID=A0A5C4U6T2_9CORY|nr:large conductance mechanosensitive channel protein MscL [Corynebacterium tapiri]TNM00572.1 large conductance mechanosensitive channel protein MscL [Corynebacterium tapiri]